MFGSTEILIIVVLIFVLFGASAIPKFAKSIGEAKAEFEKASKEGGTPKKKASTTKSVAKRTRSSKKKDSAA